MLFRRVSLCFKSTLIISMISVFSSSLYAESGAKDTTKKQVNFTADSINNIVCVDDSCFFLGEQLADGDIHVVGQVGWDSDKNLVLHTRGSIVFEQGSKITSKKHGSIILKSGMNPGKKGEYTGTVAFRGDSYSKQIEMLGNGSVKIYYNPVKGDEEHKYHNSRSYLYSEYIKTNNGLTSYMLVNDIYDLQHIRAFLHGSYALSQNIDATVTRNWFNGKGFIPLASKDKWGEMPFSGNFDGNGHTIDGLYINRPDENEIGLFGRSQGREILHNTIENLIIKNFEIIGNHYVGSLIGAAVNTDLLNIKVINPKITSIDVGGGIIGTAFLVSMKSIGIMGNNVNIIAEENKGLVIGGAGKSSVTLAFETVQDRNYMLSAYKLLGNRDKQTQVCLENNDQTPLVCLKNVPDSDKKYNGSIDLNAFPKIVSVFITEDLSPGEVKDYILNVESILNQCFCINKEKSGEK
ncbi:exported hypothetical protein [Gammaproteobacteria bacterium]